MMSIATTENNIKGLNLKHRIEITEGRLELETLESVASSMLHYASSLCVFWPVNSIKSGGLVGLLSFPTVYSLYCAQIKGYWLSIWFHSTYS